MQLSIIILNFNTKDITLNCLRSIDKYFPNIKTEVILVDNASSDGSVKAFKKLKLKNYKPIIISNSNNLGFAAGNNIGTKKAKGKHILLLNSDTKVIKSTINSLYKYAEELENAGVIGAQLLNSNKSIQASVFRFPTVYRAFKQYWLGERNLLDKYYPKKIGVSKVDVVVGAVFLITKKSLDKVGMLDERYFMYFEDFDYCRRVKKAGLNVYYVSDAKAFHIHGASGKGENASSSDWKKLIPSSKEYHGELKHYIIQLITWSGVKLKNINTS